MPATGAALSDGVEPADDLVAEQAHLDRVYTQLDELRAYAGQRLRQVLLQTGGTPQARSERESFNQMYTEDLAKYDAAEHGLCFGRIDMDETDSSGGSPDAGEQVRYIGRIGILDEHHDFDTLLLDWRAPAARPFYLATTATPEGVVRRRHIRSRNRKVTALNDEYLDLAAAQSAGVTAGDDGGVAGESALLSALNAARTGHMNDIVETIQSEQDAIIRSDHRSVMVVQGGPGTGKTAVALHRAAYLLYTYRQQLAKSGVLIIGPNATFLNYIGQVLPSLGETGVMLSTIGDLYPGVRATLVDPPRARVLKGDLAIVDMLRDAVRERQLLPGKPIVIRIDSQPVQIDRKLANRARGRARSSRRPHNLARPIFVNALLDGLTEQIAAAIGTNPAGGTNLLSNEDLSDIRQELREDPAVADAIEQLWPTLTAERVLGDLLTDPARIAAVAGHLSEDDQAVLLRRRRGFSAADAPLLDEIAELLGLDDTAERERADQQLRRQIADAQGALDILAGSAPQDLEDELDPELLMAYDVVDAEALASRQSARVRLSAAERAASDRTWTFGHVIVDEAQELSPMAWRMVMRRIPNRWITAVGDTAQTGDPAGVRSWQEVLEPYVARRWRQYDLTVNYRTPAEIMNVAADVLAAIDPAAQVPRSIRESGHVPTAVHTDRDRLAEAVQTVATDDTVGGLTAILTPTALVGEFGGLVSDQVSVLAVSQSKGLEFDSVIIVEPAAILDESDQGLNDLYVALTRATQRLTVVHTDPLPAVLHSLI